MVKLLHYSSTRNLIAFALANILVLATLSVAAQSVTLKGTVQDKEGKPLPGATVRILQTTKGAIAEANGTYEITDLRPGSYFLEVAFVGFEKRQQAVSIANESLTVDFALTQVPSQLNEIIVTADRRLQNIQKTAASVSALEAKQIEQLQVKQFTELNSIAPNFRTYDDGTIGSFTLIASRGISTIDFTPSVGLYIDDVPYFTTYAFPLSLTDVEQIEVLRGPQGTLYGRNALAGVIKITSKKAKNEWSGFATAGVGNLNAREFGLGINIPIIKDKLFFRGNANYTNRDGFVTNTFLDKDLQNRETLDANMRLKFQASDRLSLALQYSIQDRESDGYVFMLATPENSFQDILQNSLYRTSFNEDVNRQVITHNVAATVLYDFDQFTLSSVTAYQYTDQQRLDEFDYTEFDIQSAFGSNTLANISQEIRLTSSTSGSFNWTGGVFLYRLDQEIDENLRVGADASFDPLAPYVRRDQTEQVQNGLAIYGQADYELSERWTVTGGLRFDYEQVTAEVDRTFTNPEIPEGSFEEEVDFTAISPKLSVSYQANDQTFLFANVARGYRPGGINYFTTNPEDAPFDPENTLNYELGLKSNLAENRIKLNLTGFLINYTNQQVFTLLDPNSFNFGTANIGKSRSYGLEMESQWVAARGLTFNLNLGYLNTEILDFIFQAIDPNTFEPLDIDESGNQLPVSPEFNGNVNVNYILPITEKFNLETTLDYVYQSEIFWDVANDYTQDAYGLLNARLGVTSQHVDVFFWGKNLSDEAYFSYGYGVGGFNAASFGLPRTYGLTVTAKF